MTRTALFLLDLLDELDCAVLACRLVWAGPRGRVLRGGLATALVAILVYALIG